MVCTDALGGIGTLGESNSARGTGVTLHNRTGGAYTAKGITAE